MKKIWSVALVLAIAGILTVGFASATLAGMIMPAHRASADITALNNTSSNITVYNLKIVTVANIDGTHAILANVQINIYRITLVKLSNGSMVIDLYLVYTGKTGYNGTINITLGVGHYLVSGHYHKLVDRRLVNLDRNRTAILHMHRKGGDMQRGRS